MAVLILGEKHTFAVGEKVRILDETDLTGLGIERDDLNRIHFIERIENNQVTLEGCPYLLDIRSVSLC